MSGDASGSGAQTSDTNQMVLDNLLPALLQTFCLVFLGAATGWWKLMPPMAGDVLGAYTSKFALPALIIKQMASLNLGDCSVELLVGMLCAKLAVGVLVASITLCISARGSGRGRERGWSMAAIFCMLTTMQNDFALGLPILDALYSTPGDTETDDPSAATLKKSDYLYLFAPISVLIINPLCFAVLELANAVARRRNTRGSSERIGCLFLCRQVLLPTLSNPVVFCVGLGLLANVTSFPIPLAIADALDTLGASFCSLALFCLGLSMADSDDQSDENADDDDDASSDGGGDSSAAGDGDGTYERSARMSLGDIRNMSGIRSTEEDLGAARWVHACLLVGAKSLLLPIVARSFVLLLTDDQELSSFAFVYATFPAAPSVYLFAARFKLRPRDLAHVSLTTLLGTLLAAPIMFVTAQMAMINLDSETAGGMTVVLQAAEQVGYGSLVFSGWSLLVVISMLCSRSAAGRAWRRQHVVWAVFFLSLTQVFYIGLNAACAPIKNTRPELARHCTLGIEGFATASRLWGVVLLVAEIHLSHSEAASQSGGIWLLLRAGKYAVLWLAWALPGAWVGALWVSGLWADLDLKCWSCFGSNGSTSHNMEPLPPTVHYRLATSGVSTCLAVVAIGCLIWAQRQVADTAANWKVQKKERKRLGVEARQEAALADALLSAAATSVEPDDRSVNDDGGRSSRGAGPPPVWSSLRLRIVGLCNLMGLLAQVAVGVATLFRGKSMDGIMLEILAMNHFCLFAQGIATGVMLGGFSGSPLIGSLSEVSQWCVGKWQGTKGLYVNPGRWSEWQSATGSE